MAEDHHRPPPSANQRSESVTDEVCPHTTSLEPGQHPQRRQTFRPPSLVDAIDRHRRKREVAHDVAPSVNGNERRRGAPRNGERSDDVRLFVPTESCLMHPANCGSVARAFGSDLPIAAHAWPQLNNNNSTTKIKKLRPTKITAGNNHLAGAGVS